MPRPNSDPRGQAPRAGGSLAIALQQAQAAATAGRSLAGTAALQKKAVVSTHSAGAATSPRGAGAAAGRGFRAAAAGGH
jgi:hypothetical protein